MHTCTHIFERVFTYSPTNKYCNNIQDTATYKTLQHTATHACHSSLRLSRPDIHTHPPASPHTSTAADATDADDHAGTFLRARANKIISAIAVVFSCSKFSTMLL